MFTVSSTITPLNLLFSQLIGVSEPTLPEIVTIKGSTLLSRSSNWAERWKKHGIIKTHVLAHVNDSN